MEITGKTEENSSSSAEKSAVSPKETLTPEKLRTFEGMSEITDSEAEEIIDAINIFCPLIYDFLVHSENTTENIKTNLIKTAA